MSEASQSADTRQDSHASSESLPLRALSRVAPQSVQLAHDHALLGKSAWCGTVFSLAVVITVLNLLPPIPVGYQVSTQVVASPQRLDQLKSRLHSDQSQIETELPGAVHLLDIKLLDDHSGSAPTQTDSKQSTQIQPAMLELTSGQDGLTLIEVRSLWPKRTSSSAVHEWLSEITKADARTLRQIEAAATERFTHWEVQTREHYLKQFQHAQAAGEQLVSEKAEGVQAATTLASTYENSPMRFASLSGKPAAGNDSALVNDAARHSEAEQLLIRELAEARERDESATAKVKAQATQVAGVLTLSGATRVRAQPGRVPSAFVFSVLILIGATGAIGGWLHHRAQSGGIFYATEVGDSMSLLGLPVLGEIHLPHTSTAGSTVIERRLTNFRRWAVQQLLVCSEVVVMFWCLAIVIRVVLDPLWRAMLWENPLAALGRLFLGLP